MSDPLKQPPFDRVRAPRIGGEPCSDPDLWPLNQVFGTDELADVMGVSPGTIWKARMSEGLPFFMVGNKVRYRKQDVLAWLAGRVLYYEPLFKPGDTPAKVFRSASQADEHDEEDAIERQAVKESR